MAAHVYTPSPAPLDQPGLITFALSGRDTIARLAATIERAYGFIEIQDVDAAALTLRTELASPLLSGGVYYE